MLDTGTLSGESEKLPASGLRLDIRPSGWLLGGYTCFMLCLACAITVVPLSPGYKLALVLICLAAGLKLLRQHVLFSHPQAISRLVVTEAGWCFLQFNNAEVEKLSVLSQSCLTSGLVVLSFGRQKAGIQWQTRSLVVVAAMVGSDKFRQLKRQLITNPPSLTEKTLD